jgi:hypothetical protein
MSDNTPPPSPWKLNRTRIAIIAMVALAIAIILGSTLGGSLTGYEKLKEGATEQMPAN